MSAPTLVPWKCGGGASGGLERGHEVHNPNFRHCAISVFARNVVVIFHAIPMHVLRSKIIVVTGWNIHFVTNAREILQPGRLAVDDDGIRALGW